MSLLAEQAVWLVLGIGLMRNRSVSDVCDKLALAFPDSKGEFPPMATSSLVKARERLGYPHLPKVWRAKLVLIAEPQGQLKGFITSLRDPQKYPYDEIDKVYWDRWEMKRMAEELKVEPLRISFMNVLSSFRMSSYGVQAAK